MITEEEAERAVDYLRDSARSAAQARANKEYVTGFQKVLKAQIMRENPSDAIGTQEAKTYSDPRYLTHLEAIKAAVEADAHAMFLRDAAQARIDAWRTQSSNLRAG